MKKSYSTTTKITADVNHTLIIVESFSKCNKIEGYLGYEYKCIACGGHIRELKTLNNIDINNNYEPSFVPIGSKFVKKNIKQLSFAIKQAETVILATDDDREGESIAWHICKVFNLNINTTKRIKFNEITKTAILNALSQPTLIDMDMVFAQQTRQIIDLFVGFKISPVLWKHFTYGGANSGKSNKSNLLSAGRCQTPALNLIYDNHLEILNKEQCKDTQYHTIGYFTKYNIGYVLSYKFNSSKHMELFLNESIDFNHVITKSPITRKQKSPPAPFNTSSLQQQANIEFNLPPKTTMSICQKLYDNGYITYIRTDSKRYSKDFVDNVVKLINTKYGPDYVNTNIDSITTGGTAKQTDKNKTTKIQDAHESIRPTNINLKTLPKSCTPIENKLYNLIYTTTTQSCMSDAQYYSIKSKISAPHDNHYTNEQELNYFLGWQIINKKQYGKSDQQTYNYINAIANNSTVGFNTISSNEKMKSQGNHYTEAGLIKKLEQYGIGRPSTYSSLVDKIQERGYVSKQNVDGTEIECNNYTLEKNQNIRVETIQQVFGSETNKLVITSLGCLVIHFLSKFFDDIFNYEYTKNMEIDIDLISKGEKSMTDVCMKCDYALNNLTTIIKSIRKFIIKLDDDHDYIIGKYGPVIKIKSSNTFIQSKNIDKLNIESLYLGKYTLDDLADYTNNGDDDGDGDGDGGSKCDNNANDGLHLGVYNDKKVILKQGKFGIYVLYGKISISLKCLGNRPLNNIKYDEVIKLIDTKNKYIRGINDNISIRKGRYGDYIYHKTDDMKKPSFLTLKKFIKYCNDNEIYGKNDTEIDPYNCDEDILIDWVSKIE